MSTLSINCFVLGGDSSEVITVEILKTQNVSILKDLIKEKQSHRLSHADASELRAWKVSLPVDTITPDLTVDGVEAQKLGPLKKISSIFVEALVDEHVHILVQAPTVNRPSLSSEVPVHSKPYLLTLNCLMRGDHPHRIFPVKIAPIETVGALKKAIKEEKKPALDHLSANTLGLWNVSIPVDNALEESLGSLDFALGTSLLPTEELSALFPKGPAKGRLHVVVNVLGDSDMTHPAEKAHHQIIKDATAAAAPSSISDGPAMFKSEQEKRPIYDGRPANRRGPPLAIYHTAFAQLKDSLQDLNKVVDPQELKRVDDTAKLILASTQIYWTEEERASNVYPYICSLLGIKLRENVTTTTGGKKAESDTLIEQDLNDKTFGDKVAVVGHLELKNELGVAGQCAVQNTLGLRKFLANDRYKDIRNTTCCPCIVISIAGPYIMFGGAIWADIFIAEAFTDFIYLGGTGEQIVTLSRIFAAVAHALNTLKEYYCCLKLNPGSPNVNRLFPQPTYTANRHPQKIPTILSRFNYEGREPDNYRRSLFKATYNDRPVLIKFCEAYHGNAHRIVADAGYAPQLFFCERLQGGVMMVITELVDGRDAFHHFGSTKAIPSDLLDDMKAAVFILHEANLVFGDMRRPNILVKKEIDRLRALLIDFEWVGEAGQARYPPLLNDSGEIAWAEGVRPHGLMRKQHDLDMINLLNLSVKMVT